MEKNRLEAFSDGVLAIIITIMVLEMKVPEGVDIESLLSLLPVVMTYILSFVYVGIYWNNHHHLFQAVTKVNGKILWANLNLLFWLSLFPFVTAWMGENHLAPLPTALYGAVLFLAALGFKLLVHFVVKNEGKGSALYKVYQGDKKLMVSLLIYAFGISASFFFPIISVLIYLVAAILWIVPDKRIEKVLSG